MNRFLRYAVFAAGLVAVLWVGAGYVRGNPLALAITALIGVFYAIGVRELLRFEQATATLDAGLAELAAPPASLSDWLARLHPSLQNAVRLRIEGERVGLPGPSLTPYLAGLLVLLGMLGTFLGMVVTLNGTGAALQSSTDLQSMRESLSAPVRGLGLAFGTSVAGVAASAMLGLASALARRDRLVAGQWLDTRIGTALRGFSLAHRREESFRLQQLQAQAMPELVGQLRALVNAMAQQGQSLGERLVTSQDHFHSRAETVYADLAASLDRSLRQSLTESARVAGATIQPVVEATMAGIARETAALHGTVAATVQQQLDGLSSRFAASSAGVADTWTQALAEHRQAGAALSLELSASHQHFAQTFEQRSAALVDGVAARLDIAVGSVSDNWASALAQHRLASEQLSADTRHALETASAGFGDNAGALLRGVNDNHVALLQGVTDTNSALVRGVTDTNSALLQRVTDTNSALLHGVTETNTALLQGVSDTHTTLMRDVNDTQTALLQGVDGTHTALLRSVDDAHSALQTRIATRDEERLSAWTQSLAAMAASLQHEWQQAGTLAAGQQRELSDALAQTARDMAAQNAAHATSTVAEIARLLQAASEAPRAAAEVVSELRQKLSDSMARDNAMLEERSRILETLGTLLDAVNHASTEQRGAVDALVGASSELLERVGNRFTENVEAQTGKLADVAAQVTGSAVEVASLGEAFGFAVQQFGASNDKLVDHLQRIEGALGQSIARSDDQLAYYVAQARELIDLSIMSQKQIVEDLQRIGADRHASHAAAVGSEA